MRIVQSTVFSTDVSLFVYFSSFQNITGLRVLS